jgi:hypothetical protein
MKRLTMTILTGMATLLAGCVVTSLKPFYTEQDLVFEPGLLGQWMQTNSEQGLLTNNVIDFKRDGEKGYLMVSISNHEDGQNETNQAVFHLFKLGDQLFLDSLPMNTHGPEFAPLHRLYKVASISPALQMQEMKYDWLTKLLEENPTAVRHEVITERDSENKDSTRVVLTASTKELQAFVLQHLSTEDAWGEVTKCVRPPEVPTATVQPKANDMEHGR